MRESIARTLAEGLLAHGADTVFGLPGGGPNLEVVGAIEQAGLRFVLAHGETASCIMAGTYGLLRGRPAMAIATRGPGAASAVNGAAQATLDRFPLLLVTDCVSSLDRERVAHQRIDQQHMLAAVTKFSGSLANGPRAKENVRAAITLAGTAPAGAVHLDYDPSGLESIVPAPPLPNRSNPDSIEVAASLFRESRNPVAIVGIGAIADAADVLAVLARVGCPILTTYQAIGVVPEGHPQQAGLYTNGVIESAVLRDADLLVTIGLDLVEPMPGTWRYKTPVISVSGVPVLSTLLPTTIAVFGALAETLDDIVGSGPSTRSGSEGFVSLAQARAELAATSAGGFGPLELAHAVAAATPRHVLATVDAGAHFLAIMPFWPATRPLQLLISNGLATMGFAVPAAIGAALARPGTPVVCMVGDGGLSMTLAELETIARLQLPITIVVFDDAALSLIEIKQKPGQGGANAVRFGAVDFAQIGRAMGLQSTTATTATEVTATLAAGWDKPRLIDARIDPATYPKLIAATRG
jgi:acetolactate synthase I/II/III large subunit